MNIRKLMSIFLFLCIISLFITGCGNKELDRKYGISFNEVRTKNHIPILQSDWKRYPYKIDSICWFVKDEEPHKGYYCKDIFFNKNGKIHHENDLYYSGREVKCADPDSLTSTEAITIRYFFDDSEQKVTKIMVFITTEKDGPEGKEGFASIISLKEAQEYLTKWGIKADELSYNILSL